MKEFIQSFSCLLALCAFSITHMFSQTDPKYLAGAVPEVNGKVVFSNTLQFKGMNASQVYEYALRWAEANYNTEESRVAYTNREQAVVSCRGKSELLFSSGALSLDRAFMSYQLNFFGMENACKIEMKAISYEYNVANKREPEKYYAEKWITDKEALNGKTKLYRGNGKFRMKTIDLFDSICNSLNKQFSTSAPPKPAEHPTQSNIAAETRPGQVSVAVSKQETPATTYEVALQGFRKLDPKQIPGNIIKMLTDDWMLVTAGNDTKFNMMTASWGGLGTLYGKPVAFCFINPARYTFQLMESGDAYTLSFYTEAYREALRYCGSSSGRDTDKVKGSGLTPIAMPSGSKSFSEAWLIIECKKLVSQQIQLESIRDEKIRDEWSKSQSHKMYIGEILNVWVK